MVTTVNIGSLIVSTPDICNGYPRINQKRFSVAQIASLTKEGLTPQQIVDEYSFLTLAEVHAALAYANGYFEVLTSEKIHMSYSRRQ